MNRSKEGCTELHSEEQESCCHSNDLVSLPTEIDKGQLEVATNVEVHLKKPKTSLLNLSPPRTRSRVRSSLPVNCDTSKLVEKDLSISKIKPSKKEKNVQKYLIENKEKSKRSRSVLIQKSNDMTPDKVKYPGRKSIMIKLGLPGPKAETSVPCDWKLLMERLPSKMEGEVNIPFKTADICTSSTMALDTDSSFVIPPTTKLKSEVGVEVKPGLGQSTSSAQKRPPRSSFIGRARMIAKPVSNVTAKKVQEKGDPKSHITLRGDTTILSETLHRRTRSQSAKALSSLKEEPVPEERHVHQKRPKSRMSFHFSESEYSKKNFTENPLRKKPYVNAPTVTEPVPEETRVHLKRPKSRMAYRHESEYSEKGFTENPLRKKACVEAPTVTDLAKENAHEDNKRPKRVKKSLKSAKNVEETHSEKLCVPQMAHDETAIKKKPERPQRVKKALKYIERVLESAKKSKKNTPVKSEQYVTLPKTPVIRLKKRNNLYKAVQELAQNKMKKTLPAGILKTERKPKKEKTIKSSKTKKVKGESSERKVSFRDSVDVYQYETLPEEKEEHGSSETEVPSTVATIKPGEEFKPHRRSRALRARNRGARTVMSKQTAVGDKETFMTLMDLSKKKNKKSYSKPVVKISPPSICHSPKIQNSVGEELGETVKCFVPHFESPGKKERESGPQVNIDSKNDDFRPKDDCVEEDNEWGFKRNPLCRPLFLDDSDYEKNEILEKTPRQERSPTIFHSPKMQNSDAEELGETVMCSVSHETQEKKETDIGPQVNIDSRNDDFLPKDDCLEEDNEWGFNRNPLCRPFFLDDSDDEKNEILEKTPRQERSPTIFHSPKIQNSDAEELWETVMCSVSHETQEKKEIDIGPQVNIDSRNDDFLPKNDCLEEDNEWVFKRNPLRRPFFLDDSDDEKNTILEKTPRKERSPTICHSPKIQNSDAVELGETVKCFVSHETQEKKETDIGPQVNIDNRNDDFLPKDDCLEEDNVWVFKRNPLRRPFFLDDSDDEKNKILEKTPRKERSPTIFKLKFFSKKPKSRKKSGGMKRFLEVNGQKKITIEEDSLKKNPNLCQYIDEDVIMTQDTFLRETNKIDYIMNVSPNRENETPGTGHVENVNLISKKSSLNDEPLHCVVALGQLDDDESLGKKYEHPQHKVSKDANKCRTDNVEVSDSSITLDSSEKSNIIISKNLNSNKSGNGTVANDIFEFHEESADSFLEPSSMNYSKFQMSFKLNNSFGGQTIPQNDNSLVPTKLTCEEGISPEILEKYEYISNENLSDVSEISYLTDNTSAVSSGKSSISLSKDSILPNSEEYEVDVQPMPGIEECLNTWEELKTVTDSPAHDIMSSFVASSKINDDNDSSGDHNPRLSGTDDGSLKNLDIIPNVNIEQDSFVSNVFIIGIPKYPCNTSTGDKDEELNNLGSLNSLNEGTILESNDIYSLDKSAFFNINTSSEAVDNSNMKKLYEASSSSVRSNHDTKPSNEPALVKSLEDICSSDMEIQENNRFRCDSPGDISNSPVLFGEMGCEPALVQRPEDDNRLTHNCPDFTSYDNDQITIDRKLKKVPNSNPKKLKGIKNKIYFKNKKMFEKNERKKLLQKFREKIFDSECFKSTDGNKMVEEVLNDKGTLDTKPPEVVMSSSQKKENSSIALVSSLSKEELDNVGEGSQKTSGKNEMNPDLKGEKLDNSEAYQGSRKSELSSECEFIYSYEDREFSPGDLLYPDLSDLSVGIRITERSIAGKTSAAKKTVEGESCNIVTSRVGNHDPTNLIVDDVRIRSGSPCTQSVAVKTIPDSTPSIEINETPKTHRLTALRPSLSCTDPVNSASEPDSGELDSYLKDAQPRDSAEKSSTSCRASSEVHEDEKSVPENETEEFCEDKIMPATFSAPTKSALRCRFMLPSYNPGSPCLSDIISLEESGIKELIVKYFDCYCLEKITTNLCCIPGCNKLEKIPKDFFEYLPMEDITQIVRYLLKKAPRISENFMVVLINFFGYHGATNAILSLSKKFLAKEFAPSMKPHAFYFQGVSDAIFDALKACGFNRPAEILIEYNKPFFENCDFRTLVDILDIWEENIIMLRPLWPVIEPLISINNFVLPDNILKKLLPEVLECPNFKSKLDPLTNQLLLLPEGRLMKIDKNQLAKCVQLLLRSGQSKKAKCLYARIPNRHKVDVHFENEEEGKASPFPLKRHNSMPNLSNSPLMETWDFSEGKSGEELLLMAENNVTVSVKSGNYKRLINTIITYCRSCEKELLGFIFECFNAEEPIFMTKILLAQFHDRKDFEKYKPFCASLILSFIQYFAENCLWPVAFEFFPLFRKYDIDRYKIKITELPLIRICFLYSEVLLQNGFIKEALDEVTGFEIHKKLNKGDFNDLDGDSRAGYILLESLLVLAINAEIIDLAGKAFMYILNIQMSNEPIDLIKYFEVVASLLFERPMDDVPLKIFERLSKISDSLAATLSPLTIRALCVMAFKFRKWTEEKGMVVNHLFSTGLDAYAYPVLESGNTIILLKSFTEEEMRLYLTEWILNFRKKIEYDSELREICKNSSNIIKYEMKERKQILISFKDELLREFVDSPVLGIPNILKVNESLEAAVERLTKILRELGLRVRSVQNTNIVIEFSSFIELLTLKFPWYILDE